MKVKRTCQQCGKEFSVKPSIVKKGGGKFCSKKCEGLWRSQNIRKDKCHTWRGGKIKRTCIICGKEFEVNPSLIKRGGGKFCSHKCKGKWQTENWKSKKIGRICQICGKEFFVRSFKIKEHRGKFCSRKCADKWRSENRKGDKSPTWKGGLSPITHRIRKNLKYSNWRLAVFERDNFTCRKCGQRGGQLHAHHIKPFSQILKELKQQYPLFDLYDMAMMYEPLWDVSNSITLCENCHNKEHIK